MRRASWRIAVVGPRSFLFTVTDKKSNSMKWIKVEDELPERGVRVLAWGKGWYSVGDCFYGTQENHHHYCHADGECKEVTWRWHEDGTTVRHANVTHWMPLPEPPSGN